MRSRIGFLAAGVVALAGLSFQSNSAAAQRDDHPFRDEFRQTYSLVPGAGVQLSGVNGPVEIHSHAGNEAEVHIIRSARSQEGLDHRIISVTHTPDRLVVKIEKNPEYRSHRNGGRERVTLRVPARIELETSGVNGPVKVDRIDGTVTVSGINGPVSIQQAMGHSNVSGVNGTVNITVAGMDRRGVKVSGINGAVELQFSDRVDADLDVSGINGSVYTELPDIVLQGKLSPNRVRATIGSGGAPITVSGVNGRVRLSPSPAR